MFQLIEFKTMNFLNYTVETYEHWMSKPENNSEDDEVSNQTIDNCGRYIIPHPKVDTHVRIHWFNNHVYLPNTVGPWLPCQDSEQDSRPYYFAAMLTFLKPWRKLEDLKDHHKCWEENFALFIENASQQDRDVITEIQYYYKSKNVLANRISEEERRDVEKNNNNNKEGRDNEDEVENKDNLPLVGVLKILINIILKK
jgi:hypothetical protein